MTEKRKPILCLDFDGVLHSYTSGWQGADVIPDPPVPGMAEFLDRAVEEFAVAIYSSRSETRAGINAMRYWLRLWLIRAFDEAGEPNRADQVFHAIQWPISKPPAFLSIDDRAIQFDGTWPDLADLRAFQPWNKKPPTAAQEGQGNG